MNQPADPALIDAIAAILLAAPGLRAADIAAQLQQQGSPANRQAVNQALYRGAFVSDGAERAAGAGRAGKGAAAPRWSVDELGALARLDHFEASAGAAAVCRARSDLSPGAIRALLEALAELAPGEPKKFRHAPTDAGAAAGAVAAGLGFAVSARPAP